MHKILICTLAGALAVPHAQAQVPVIFVDVDATGAGDGSSWQDAFAGPLGLQAALGAVPIGQTAEVWVASGTYLPGPLGSGPAAHFALRDGVALYGGFEGSESELEQRDPVAHPTVLSGDLAGDDELVQPVLWAPPMWLNVSDNAQHLVRADGVGPTARLDGFVLRRGSATGQASGSADRGALLLFIDASPTVASCLLTEGDAAGGGGAVYAHGGAPLFIDCSFRENRAPIGAGVWLQGAFDARFEHCAWIDNRGGRGVGLHAGPALLHGDRLLMGTLHVADSRFEGNLGELGAPAGMGILASGCTLLVERTRFAHNVSHGGGGGAYLSAAEARFDACDFVGNEGASDGGGAIYVDGGGSMDVRTTRLISCRLVGNNGVAVAAFGGRLELESCTAVANHLSEFTWPAFVVQSPSTIALAHCIVRDHEPVGPGLAGHFVEILGPGFTLEGCCVEDWDGTLPGDGNFDLDPLFVAARGADGIAGTDDDDLRLSAASPCIDRGPGSGADVLAKDFDGAPRYVDRADVPDGPGQGCAPRSDLGCHELGPDGPWEDVGFALVGTGCPVHLVGSGSLTPGSPTRLDVVQAPATAAGVFVLGFAPLAIPLFGGTLWPEPTVVLPSTASPSGALALTFDWPMGLPSGFELHAQAWLLDAGAPFGVAASNAVRGAAP